MPKGTPKARTVRNAKWNQKAGYRTKAFNLKGDTAERFADACAAMGRSQASVIQELMSEFIEKSTQSKD